ncbi:MAG: metal-dependent transcriptional regulator [Lentisphaeria bacterium]|nr:metal-dependent transcriptional regulator [Lentisphaeria bacterium]
MKKILPISSSQEDYLEAIAEILEHQEHAHTKDIATKLNVTMPSVTNALQTLSARGLIIYRSHTPVRLTAAGAEKAAIIRRRHHTLKHFFSQLLKVDDKEADEAACRIEHVFKEPLVSRMVRLIEAVESHEDCAGLRAYLERTMPTINLDPDSELISLDRLPKHKRAVLTYVADTLRGVKKFADMGLVPGAEVEYEGTAPFGELIRIKLMDTSLSLRAADAKHFWVRVMEK